MKVNFYTTEKLYYQCNKNTGEQRRTFVHNQWVGIRRSNRYGDQDYDGDDGDLGHHLVVHVVEEGGLRDININELFIIRLIIGQP